MVLAELAVLQALRGEFERSRASLEALVGLRPKGNPQSPPRRLHSFGREAILLRYARSVALLDRVHALTAPDTRPLGHTPQDRGPRQRERRRQQVWQMIRARPPVAEIGVALAFVDGVDDLGAVDPARVRTGDPVEGDSRQVFLRADRRKA
jgi:hypothetical protein